MNQKSASLTLSQLKSVVTVCDRYEAAWNGGERPSIERFLDEVRPAHRSLFFRKLIELEIELRHAAGETPTETDYSTRFPHESRVISAVFGSESLFSETRKETGVRLRPGERIGEYELLECIGRGGMGVVFKARQPAAERVVALKLIIPELMELLPDSHREELVERFHEEVKAAAALDHDHIVPVYGPGQSGDFFFYSMRYIEGQSLARKLSHGPLSNQETASILLPIARAIAFAHSKDIVHRDLNPRNILLDAADRPYVTDFGLAKRTQAVQQLTPAGSWLGKPSYLAPEQARDATSAGPPCDVYGLGATMYEMLTGRPPFLAADAVETLRQVIDTEPVSPRKLNPSVARDLETICLKCLAKVPDHRYSSAAELAGELERFLHRRPIKARPVTVVERTWRWVRRQPTQAALVAVLIAAVPVTVIGMWLSERRLQAARVENLIDGLAKLDQGQVAGALNEFRSLGAAATEKLRLAFASEPENSPTRLRIAIALLHTDDTVSDYLYSQTRFANPEDLLLIRAAMGPRLARYAAGLREVLSDPKAGWGRRIRAACLLKDAEPEPNWGQVAEAFAADLVVETPPRAAGWARAIPESLKPLLAPRIRKSFDDRSLPERSRVAAAALAEFFADAPRELVELTRAADARQLPYLIEKMARNRTAAIELLGRIARMGAGPLERPEEADLRVEEQVNVALALVALGEAESGWNFLTADNDPRGRVIFTHRMAPMGMDIAEVFRRIEVEPNEHVRQALILGLGEYPDGEAVREDREARTKALLDLVRHDPSPGIHSAAEWVLRKWGLAERLRDFERAMAGREPEPGKRWYVSKEGHVMAMFPSVREPLQIRGLEADTRLDGPALGFGPFAIATKELTVEQYLKWPDRKPLRGKDNPELPVGWLKAFEAEQYCNWLSGEEGLDEKDWCYERRDSGAIPEMRLKPNFRDLAGYRLPTEAEWELAAQHTPTLNEFFTRHPALVGQYAWFQANSHNQPQYVGRLKPNDHGLFDFQGNVSEWCADRILQGNVGQQYYHGMNFQHPLEVQLKHIRGCVAPSHFDGGSGFRLAKTLTGHRLPPRSTTP